MNKKFKRALSSILAFAMVLSMMTVLNVSTAFAAATTIDFTSTTYHKAYSADTVIVSNDDVTIKTTTSRGIKVENNYVGVAANSTSNESWYIDGATKTINVRNLLEIKPTVAGTLTIIIDTLGSETSEKTVKIFEVTDVDNKKANTINSISESGSTNVTFETEGLEANKVYYYSTPGTNPFINSVTFTPTITGPTLSVDSSIMIAPGSTDSVSCTYSGTGTITCVSETPGVSATYDSAEGKINITVESTVAEGTEANITVSASDVTESATITVTCGSKINVDSVTLNKESMIVYVGKTNATKTLTATVIPDDASYPEITWGTSDATVATVSNGTVTGVKAGTATITATNEDSGLEASCAVTVKDVPSITASSTQTSDDNTISALVAADKSTTYDLLAAAEDKGFGEDYEAVVGSDGKTTKYCSLDAVTAYAGKSLYFDNQIASVGANSVYYGTKTSYDLDGTVNQGGIRVRWNTDVLALKLANGSTINVSMTGGGGDREGKLYSDMPTYDSTNGVSGTQIATTTGMNAGNALLTYTNTTGADQVVYLTSTKDTFISQIRVVVPTCESEIKTVGNSTYVIFKITEAQRAAASSFDVVKTLDGTSVVSGEATVYTGIDFDSADTADDVTAVDGTYVIAYLIGSITDGATDVATKFDIKFN